MKTHSLIALALAFFTTAGVVTTASAAEKTRAEVRAELIQAEQNGLRFVTDASYPDVAPIYQQQVAQMNSHGDAKVAGSMGGTVSGSSAAGVPDTAMKTKMPMSACVGPVSFCQLYFGS